MIYDKNDADFEDKVKQVRRCTCVSIPYFITCYLYPGNVSGSLLICVCLPQLIEVSGKTQDECMVALHDCNEDVNRAINFLLESPSDAVRVTHLRTTLQTDARTMETSKRPRRHRQN